MNVHAFSFKLQLMRVLQRFMGRASARFLSIARNFAAPPVVKGLFAAVLVVCYIVGVLLANNTQLHAIQSGFCDFSVDLCLCQLVRDPFG